MVLCNVWMAELTVQAKVHVSVLSVGYTGAHLIYFFSTSLPLVCVVWCVCVCEKI